MYKKLRFAARFSTALVSKYRLAILIGLLIGMLAYLLVPRIMSRLAVLRPTQKIGLVGRYTLADMPTSITAKISLGLTVLTESGQPGPGLAAAFSATDSGKTYIFTLDPRFHWHDGTQVKSRDIQYNFKDATVSYPDDTHLIITVPDPFAPLPSVVAKPLLKSISFPRRYLGVGAYKISSLAREGSIIQSVTLVPADTQSNLPNLRYIFYPTQSQARTALKLGLLSAVVDLTDPGELSDWPNFTINSQIHTDRYVAVFFNTEDSLLSGPNGKNLRLALSYAIDKSRFDPDIRATGPIPANSWAYNPDIKTYPRDLPRAKQLLGDADGADLEINLSAVPAYLATAEAVKKDWEELGVTVHLQVTPDLPESFQALIVAQAIPPDPDQYNFWHSTQKRTNLTKLNNPRIDKLLEDGRKTIDLDARQTIYQDFQRFLLEEAPAVFLFHPQSYTITRK